MKWNKYILFCLILGMAACKPGDTPELPDQEKVVDKMPKSAKRGVAFSFSQVEDLPLLTDAISWDYNWGNDQNSLAATWMDEEHVEYCPMCWSNNYNADRIRAYVQAHPSTKYLLGYNEPNLKDQANMTPTQAAAKWGGIVELAKELNLKLVSPAMNYGTLAGYSDPIKWLDEFFAQPGVSIDDIDVISIHCYMASPQALKDYVARFYKYNKPIWMTEFCAWEEYAIHSEEDQINYMCQVLNYMEQDPKVERYAWFIPRAKAGYPYMQLLTSAQPYELTRAGKVYCGFSSFDKSVWLRASTRIAASDYIALSDDKVQVRPSSDGDGLMLSVFSPGQAAEYQIYVDKNATQLQVRYAGGAGNMTVWLDDDPVAVSPLPATGNMTTWQTQTIPVDIPAGKHLLRLEMESGVVNVAWLQITTSKE
ncbi:MAG: carbohydrate-binding protein [Paludibacteraceae bacterium]|nr:carbohydrate-binding protein [Paludibacteraceae bacterium]